MGDHGQQITGEDGPDECHRDKDHYVQQVPLVHVLSLGLRRAMRNDVHESMISG